MAAFDTEEEYRDILASANIDNQRVELAPTVSQKLGAFSVACLILNRTIGSGIFVTPTFVLEGTGSVGASLVLWAVGGLLALCGLLVWLELGLTVPLRKVPGDDTGGERSVPRSGGEKNFFEFLYSRPAFLTTCMFGTVFILLGNLSGNGLAFGQYCYLAAGIPTGHAPKGGVIGIAIAALTSCILLHMFSRRGGIALSNCFAVFKVALLIACIILGFIKAGGGRLGSAPAQPDHQDTAAAVNFNPSTSFSSRPRDVGSFADSLLYILYTYSGFEQPFYVLSEVRRPRKTFPRATLSAMALVIVLFILINVAYFCAVPADLQFENPSNRMATLFLGQIFGDDAAQSAMAALIAVSIFGNILVMTFTAARVKQEIAKEGILPFSLFFATSYTSLAAWLKMRMSRRPARADGLQDHAEQTPVPALLLHWFSSLVLIAVTAMLTPSVSYSILVSLYSYVIVIGFGFVTAGGLLFMYTPLSKRDWRNVCNFRVPLAPLHSAIYFVACGFLLYAAFAPPSAGSRPASGPSGYPWYIVPAIGQSAWLWGVVWFVGFRVLLWLRRETPVVHRVPVIALQAGEWVQMFEVVTHERHVASRNAPLDPVEPLAIASEVDLGHGAYDSGPLHMGGGYDWRGQ